MTGKLESTAPCYAWALPPFAMSQRQRVSIAARPTRPSNSWRPRAWSTTFPRGKRRVFQAEDPDQLLRLAERKQQALSQAMEQLRNEVIPELKQSRAVFSPGNVRFYEGDDGVELVLRDILNSTEADPERGYAVISTKTLREHLYRPFPNFTRQRESRGIRVRVIAVGEGGDEAEYAERKWLPSSDTADASYIAIYPPKVAMITLADENYPVVVIIDSAAIASTQQILFDTLWQLL